MLILKDQFGKDITKEIFITLQYILVKKDKPHTVIHLL